MFSELRHLPAQAKNGKFQEARMDFTFSPAEEQFKQEVHQFFENDEATDGMRKETESGLGFGPYSWEILRKAGSKGWLTPTWPKKYGGLELSDMYRYIFMEEMDYFTTLNSLTGAGMAGPIILRYGNEAQKGQYLPRIARGEIEFALGYTEPEAGSDLANLSIKAEDKGDYFILNGGKIFNTRCHYSQYHWLGARTEVIKPKHRGISLLIVDLKLPGITVLPIWTMSGYRTNEVYYDNVEVSKECLVGEKNRGFYYILEALDYERIYSINGLLKLFDIIVNYAKERGKNSDPVIRQKLAALAIELEVAKLFALRVPWMLDQGKVPNYEAAMLKVVVSELEQRIINTGMQISDLRGQLQPGSKWTLLDVDFPRVYLDSVRNLLTRGTCEIMRNVIAQRGLGLPRG